ncbi:TPA: thr operon leader peptide [Escherichia coli]|uniref:thr operon leader peptide n=1 Tax=Escherichia coli TaxID=562 RepID=A0AAN5GUT9_ECOLX|nr:thr operon leader peptide [Escherichia coli]EFA8828338.1 thr operon leader peptide [Escherichia coli O157:H7]EFR7838449.1 thr operon leader peptide [Shigella flexneri]MDU1458049.1 thr operon leader peptide [Klebsiella sp.]HAX0313535.1 thr operon leader peptide [Escherichia coli CD400]EED1749008.1 thr operon leader peptide [Escherichia coli]
MKRISTTITITITTGNGAG